MWLGRAGCSARLTRLRYGASLVWSVAVVSGLVSELIELVAYLTDLRTSEIHLNRRPVQVGG